MASRVSYSNRIRVFIIGGLTVAFFILQAPLSSQRPSLPSLANHQWKASETEVSSWNIATADTDIHSID